MKLIFDGGLFLWDGGYKTRLIPKEAGLWWNPAIKRWWTKSPTVASRLWQYADSVAKAEIGSVNGRVTELKQRTAILTCLQMLAEVCDGAKMEDMQGFSKSDTDLGRALACKRVLTPEQAEEGRQMVIIHQCQLPKALARLAITGIWHNPLEVVA